jgi:hypothetical protein
VAALSLISITTGTFLHYHASIGILGPVMIWTWRVAAAGRLFGSSSWGPNRRPELPLAGASYRWGARMVNSTVGWFVDALGAIFGAVALPGIMFVAATPLSEYVVDDTTCGRQMTLSTTLLPMMPAYPSRVISVQLAAWVHSVAVFTDIVGAIVGSIVLWFLDMSTATRPRSGAGVLREGDGRRQFSAGPTSDLADAWGAR